MATTINELKRLKPEFANMYIKNLQGKDFMLYNGLILLAKEKGLKQLTTKIVQFPMPANDNTCIVEATLVGIETVNGQAVEVTHSEIGDANLGNTNKNVSKHFIRMAATRAKGRALRDFLGIDAVMVEELGDGPFEAPADPAKMPITQQQVSQITALKNTMNMDKEVLKQLAVQTVGTGDISQFTMAMADMLIAAMNNHARQPQAPVQQQPMQPMAPQQPMYQQPAV